VAAGVRSGYFKVSGIGAPMSSKASRWALVGSASMGMVAVVPASTLGRPGRRTPGRTAYSTDQPGSLTTRSGSSRSRLPRRFIVRLATTASRALPAVASHAIGFADPRPGGHSPVLSAY
jgi:hypothetical protein